MICVAISTIKNVIASAISSKVQIEIIDLINCNCPTSSLMDSPLAVNDISRIKIGFLGNAVKNFYKND